MTSEGQDSRAYVWIWLPGASDPVVAGVLDGEPGRAVTFTYGRSYLERPDAIALYEPELPLVSGPQLPRSGAIAGCIADAGPDAWGRRVIEQRRTDDPAELTQLSYLLASGSDRIGALDFQHSAREYVPRHTDAAPLEQLMMAADHVDSGTPLDPALDLALMHGSSVGGARPKALLVDRGRRMIAKFSASTDVLPVVKAEFAAMRLAAAVGLDVARVELVPMIDRDVLLIDRFDRSPTGARRLMVSALTMLELHDADGMAGRYATYHDLADDVRRRFSAPDATLRELFARIAFNIAVGNTDDHPRNHAAFWDGIYLTLTPAYDICPQNRTGEEAAQAMAYGPGERASNFAGLIRHCGIYHLDETEGRNIIDAQVAVIEGSWSETAEEARLSEVDRNRLWGRQILNPFCFYDY